MSSVFDEKSPLLNQEELMDWIRPVEDPELFMSLVELGLIYSAEMDSSHFVAVKMTLTSPACPAGGYMIDQIKQRLMENSSVKEAAVEIVFEPKWDPKIMASETAKEALGLW